MCKVVVLGTLGMAGHIIAEYLDSIGEYEVSGVARRPGRYVNEIIDALDFSLLEAFLTSKSPDVVINCIGLLVSSSANQITNAILINSYLPQFIGELGDKLGFKCIQVSTDCVFSGKDGGYSENSFRDGDDNYARTKALGELFSEKHLTIRTSIIGPELKSDGTGLMGWFFSQNGEVNGYTKAYWSGVTTLELAKEIHRIIQKPVAGLVHVCPDEKVSKYELLRLINEIWARNCHVIPYDAYAIDKSLIRTREDYCYLPSDYRTMLFDLKNWTDSHPDYYLHYNLEHV